MPQNPLGDRLNPDPEVEAGAGLHPQRFQSLTDRVMSNNFNPPRGVPLLQARRPRIKLSIVGMGEEGENVDRREHGGFGRRPRKKASKANTIKRSSRVIALHPRPLIPISPAQTKPGAGRFPRQSR